MKNVFLNIIKNPMTAEGWNQIQFYAILICYQVMKRKRRNLSNSIQTLYNISTISSRYNEFSKIFNVKLRFSF